MPLSATARAVAILVVAAACVWFAAGRERALRREVERLQDEVRAASLRQRELESQVARQHETIRSTESSLEMMRVQMESVEMQLDGVDYLSREVRGELGLPETAGSWEGIVPDGPPSGGAYVPARPDQARLSLAQRRLAAGAQELQSILDALRARRQSDRQPDAGAEPESRPVGPPANWPARGPVTSDFGWRLFRSLPNFHMGIDIALPYGTPVAATADGLVLGSGWQPGFGWSVFVQHPGGYHTLFGHLSETVVRVGDVVAPGTAIGRSGSSGMSTGPHLHYEVWKDGMPVDPRPLMDGGASR